MRVLLHFAETLEALMDLGKFPTDEEVQQFSEMLDRTQKAEHKSSGAAGLKKRRVPDECSKRLKAPQNASQFKALCSTRFSHNQKLRFGYVVDGWAQVFHRPYPKSSGKLDEATPTAHFE